jgi:hypothetical protein
VEWLGAFEGVSAPEGLGVVEELDAVEAGAAAARNPGRNTLAASEDSAENAVPRPIPKAGAEVCPGSSETLRALRTADAKAEAAARGPAQRDTAIVAERKLDTKQIDRIVKEVGLSREQFRLLHDGITGQG